MAKFVLTRKLRYAKYPYKTNIPAFHYSIIPTFHYSNCERSELTCFRDLERRSLLHADK